MSTPTLARHYTAWTEDDLAYLAEFPEASDEEVAAALSRTPASIHTKRYMIACSTERHEWLREHAVRGNSAWNDEDWRTVADFTIDDLDAAEQLYRTPDAIWTRRSEIRMGQHAGRIARAKAAAEPQAPAPMTLAELYRERARVQGQLARLDESIAARMAERGW